MWRCDDVTGLSTNRSYAMHSYAEQTVTRMLERIYSLCESLCVRRKGLINGETWQNGMKGVIEKYNEQC